MLFVLLAAGFGLYSGANSFLGASRESKATHADLAKQRDIDTARAAIARDEEQKALIESRLRLLLQKGDRLRAEVKELDAELARWETEIPPLLRNDDGRYLAAERHFADSFQAHYRAKRPSVGDADTLRTRIAAITGPIEARLREKNFSTPPAPAMADELDAIDGEIESLIGAARGPRLEIEGLLAAAKRAGRKGEKSLDEAIQFYFAIDAQDRSRREDEIRDRERRDFEERRLKVLEQTERERNQAALRLLEAEKRAEVAAIDAQATAKSSESDRQDLVAKASAPEVKQMLAFFLTPGFKQPDGSTSTAKQPISYSKLVSIGALDDSEQGLNRLRKVMYDYGEQVRPRRRDLEGSVLTTQHIEILKPIQDHLRQFGPTLVELNLLAQ